MLSFRSRKTTQPPASDVATLEALFDSLEEPLLAYALKITDCVESAQDVVQEAFLSFQKAATEIRSPRAWLYRSVHNLAINLSKREARLQPISEESEELSSQIAELMPNEALERLEIVGLTRLFLKSLDKRSAQVVSMKFDDGLTYQQIAERTGLTPSNVGYILHHAVAALAAEFEKLGVGK